MKKINYIFSIFYLLCCFGAWGQQTGQLEKADVKFDKYNYIDARKIYLKVVENGYKSAEIYRKLGDTYYFNSNYPGAAKWYYNLIKEYPESAEAVDYFRTAQCLKSIDEHEEAERLMSIYKEKGGQGLKLETYKNIADTLLNKGVNDKNFENEKIAQNSDFSDFGPAFLGDSTIVFASNGKLSEDTKVSDWDNQPYLDLYEAKVDEEMNVLSASPLKGNDINSPYHESTTAFTEDGKTMYFTRNNYFDGKKGHDKDKVVRLKIYKATKNGNNWNNVKELPFNDDSYSVAHPALDKDDERLYFASDMPGTKGMSDLWYVDILGDDIYSEPINLGDTINTVARESFPFMSSEDNLYFSSDGHLGMGGLDVFVVKLNDTIPKEILTFGEPINSAYDDFGFIIKEGRLGYFTSNRDGAEGNKGDDIYQFWERCEISVVGDVTNKKTKELLPGATVTIFDSNNEVVGKQVVGDDAKFNFMLDCGENYVIRGEKEGFLPAEEIIETPKNAKTVEMPIALDLELVLEPEDPCPPDDLGCRLTLQPIYFDFDKSNIRPDAEIELAKILVALNEYPQLKIHIESHTDSRGNDTYNASLSERRAQSTLQWLIDKGVSKDRLSAKGYGESQLVNQCGNGVDCTEDEHQLNRRSMFIIVD